MNYIHRADCKRERADALVAWAQRNARWVKWASIELIIVALFVIYRVLPLQAAIHALGGWLGNLGVAGPLIYALIYALAAVLFLPGSVLTIAAGVFFGLWWGTAAVSLGSTTGAALAFLIGRYLAREAVARKIRRFPKFEAVDQAIAEGGWRVVALLRLSPAVPFNIQNHLYGLTAIRFWPAILTSWLGMLPGTFMYVYLGYISRAGLEAAGGETSRSLGQWILLVVGLLATVVLTVYVTRLARRKIRERTDTETVVGSVAQSVPAETPRRWPWGATVLALCAFLLTTLAAWTCSRRETLRGLFGPPTVQMREAYAGQAGGPVLDHSLYDGLLRKYVAPGGWVDYVGLKSEAATLDQYIAALGKAPFEELGRDEKLALLINAYNAFTLRLILDHYPLQSIKYIPSAQRWDDKRWHTGTHTWSLNEIEQQQIRPKFKEPRVHFALVCAAIGCPPLRAEAYAGARLGDQLEDQTRYVHTHDRWFRFDPQKNDVYLTPLYEWYGGDFKQTAGSVLEFAARYSPELKAVLAAKKTPAIHWLDYDWRLNSKENVP